MFSNYNYQIHLKRWCKMSSAIKRGNYFFFLGKCVCVYVVFFAVKSEHDYVIKENDDEIYKDELVQHFTTCSLITDLKRQKAYLSPKDCNVVFDEAKHIYLLPDKHQQFPISVTGFCKQEIHHNDFDAVKILRNLQIPDTETDYDMHAFKLVEWKYASVFGTLFHAIVEYFFNKIVNGCKHTACQNQWFNQKLYHDCQIQETNNYNISLEILTQCQMPDTTFVQQPIMPCIFTTRYYDIFVRVVTKKENFVKFLNNHYRYNINNESYIQEIVNNMETAFDNADTTVMKSSTRRYRGLMGDRSYDYSIDQVMQNFFSIETYLHDLECHLHSFRNILLHLPLQKCCDIRPEFIVFSENHGLAGSVDLTMRMRHDPRHLLVYDWKTCKKIFNTIWRNKEQTNQLMDYSCQLHTYANLICEQNPEFQLDLFVVNITKNDACIYNVGQFLKCTCCNIFDHFKKPMINK